MDSPVEPIISAEVIIMIDQITISNFAEMRLSAMADEFKSQSEDEAYETLSFEDRFGILVDAEWSKRRSVKLRSCCAMRVSLSMGRVLRGSTIFLIENWTSPCSLSYRPVRT